MTAYLPENKKDFIYSFLLALGFGVFILCFHLFLLKATFVTAAPNDQTLYRWDAGVYLNVSQNGYNYPDPVANNTGVFILFPWVWRLLHVGIAGMSIANYIFFAIGFSILSCLYKLNTVEKLLWLSVPTVYIMYIPYTEALFFLLMTLTFYGIVKKKRWLVWITLFLASLARPTSIFLLPGLFLMEVLVLDKKDWYKVLRAYLLDYALPILAGLGFFIWYQYYSVGIWFAYFSQQRRTEGHVFNWPVLPFSSGEGNRNMWISAIAMFCCFLAIIVVIRMVVKWLFNNVKETDKLLVLSLVFLGAVLYKNIFYNPTWGTNTTLTIGINRYVFATPFFYIFLRHFTNRLTAYKPVDYLVIFMLSNVVWLSCGAYMHIRYFLFFNFCTLIIFVYMLSADKKLAWPALIIMALNIFFQIIMFQQFLTGLYLD